MKTEQPVATNPLYFLVPFRVCAHGCLLQFYSLRTRHKMDDIRKTLKNGCNSVEGLIRLWMYVIKKNERFVVMNGKTSGRNTSELYLCHYPAIQKTTCRFLFTQKALRSRQCFSLILFHLSRQNTYFS